MKMKRIAASAAAILMALTLFSGCSQTGSKTITAPTDEVAQKLMDSLSFEYPLNQLPEDAANRLYKLDGEILEEQAVYVGTGGALADEVSVWRVKDEKDAKTVQEAAEKRVENQKGLCPGGNAQIGKGSYPSRRGYYNPLCQQRPRKSKRSHFQL